MSKPVAVATHGIGRLVGRARSTAPTEPATFVGLATLTTSRPDLSGPYSRPVGADLLIDRRGRITLTSVHVEPAQLGSVTCVISLLPGTGRGRYAAGKLQLTLGLLFRIDVLGGVDSEISLTLTTDPRGPRTDPDGRITATGTATFQKGYLGGRTATLVVNGTITR
ncbi:MAG: hypothetical protein ACOH10_14435 [Rhodoglobus sp.]